MRKKLFFLLSVKRGGVSSNQKNPYQEILRFFGPKGGGVSSNSKGFYQIFFGIICQNMGVLYKKKLVVF